MKVLTEPWQSLLKFRLFHDLRRAGRAEIARGQGRGLREREGEGPNQADGRRAAGATPWTRRSPTWRRRRSTRCRCRDSRTSSFRMTVRSTKVQIEAFRLLVINADKDVCIQMAG